MQTTMVGKALSTTWKVHGVTPMYWFIKAPYKSPPNLGSCVIYIHHRVIEHFHLYSKHIQPTPTDFLTKFSSIQVDDKDVTLIHISLLKKCFLIIMVDLCGHYLDSRFPMICWGFSSSQIPLSGAKPMDLTQTISWVFQTPNHGSRLRCKDQAGHGRDRSSQKRSNPPGVGVGKTQPVWAKNCFH